MNYNAVILFFGIHAATKLILWSKAWSIHNERRSQTLSLPSFWDRCIRIWVVRMVLACPNIAAGKWPSRVLDSYRLAGLHELLDRRIVPTTTSLTLVAEKGFQGVLGKSFA